MPEPTPNYQREFLQSTQHAWLGFLTLGAGFLSAQPLFLVLGATAYALGWIYFPDAGFFRRAVDRRNQAARQAAALREVEEFVKRRETILAGLSPSRRDRYRELAKVCEDIEQASADNPLSTNSADVDPRLRKLDELMWTFLRLLGIEESLELFLETESREEVPRLVQEGEREVASLTIEIEKLKQEGRKNAIESKQRLLNSRTERLDVLQKRLERIEQAQANLALVVSEQERLNQQIKLIRADAIASKNAQTLSARIDATVEHLDQTNRWLAEMDEFKDLVGDLPATEMRVGYRPNLPPLIDGEKSRVHAPTRTRQKQ